MIVKTAARTTTKLERHVLEPYWLQAVVDDGDAGFLVESAEEIAYVNRAYAAMLGYDSPAQLRGNHLSVIVADTDAPRLLNFSRMRVRDLPAPRSYQFDARRRDRSVVRLQAAVSASRVEKSVVIATIALPCERRETPEVETRDSDPATPRRPLSPREMEVMEMILAGKRMKEIAFTLNVSPKTVTTHRTRLLYKLHLTSLRDLFQYAVTNHLVEWD